MDLGFPRTLDAVTPQWLTEVLQADGVIGDAVVVAFDSKPLGAGAGFMSSMLRLTLTYSDPGCGGPRNLIVKLTSPDPGSRQIDQAFNFYEKEVGFYQRIAPSTPIRAPKAHFSGYDPEVREYTLLLEDLTPLRVADQLDGLTFAQTEQALRSLAGLHGRWWRDPALPDMPWLITLNSPQMKALEPIYQQCWPATVAFLGDAMPPQMRALGDRFANQIGTLQDKVMRQPCTVVHGDYRADNIFFSEDGASDGFAVADWQIVMQAGGALDVAYLLTGSIDRDLRRAHETDLLRAYHDALTSHGVNDYAFEVFREDYRACVMLTWCWPVIAIGALDHANERGVALFRTWTDRAMAAIADLDAGAVLS